MSDKFEMVAAKQVREMVKSAVRGTYENLNELRLAFNHAFMHACEHGDVSLLQEGVALLADRGDGKPHSYTTGITAWIGQHAPIMVKKTGNWGLRGKDAPEYKPFDVEGALATPFWLMQPAGSNKLMTAADVIALIGKPGKAFSKAVEDGRVQMGAADIALHKAAFEAAQATYQRMVGLVSDAPAKTTSMGTAVPTAPVRGLDHAA